MMTGGEFWKRVAKVDGDGCWEWTATRTDRGYGVIGFQVDGRNTSVGAHRRSWELTHGAIPARLHVLPRCDNPPCVRPDHLFLGTHKDNMRDAKEKGRIRGGFKARKRRHETYSGSDIKSLEDVKQEYIEKVFAEYGELLPQYVIAYHLGVSPTTLVRMRKRSANGETLVGDRR